MISHAQLTLTDLTPSVVFLARHGQVENDELTSESKEILNETAAYILGRLEVLEMDHSRAEFFTSNYPRTYLSAQYLIRNMEIIDAEPSPISGIGPFVESNVEKVMRELMEVEEVAEVLCLVSHFEDLEHLSKSTRTKLPTVECSCVELRMSTSGLFFPISFFSGYTQETTVLTDLSTLQ